MAPIPSSTATSGGLRTLARNIAQLGIFSNLQKRTTLSSQRNSFSAASLCRYPLTIFRDLAQSISPSSSSSSSHLQRRDRMISIPSTYSSFTSSPGTVVGIVVGTVGGFVLLIWILFLIFGGRRTVVDDMTTVTDDSRPPHRSQSHRRRPEVIEVMSESTSSRSEDVVEVFEELSTPSQSERRSYSKRTGSYRTVDPREYGGGRAPGRRLLPTGAHNLHMTSLSTESMSGNNDNEYETRSKQSTSSRSIPVTERWGGGHDYLEG